MPARVPYPGLRPFRRDEADVFFGREEHVDQLLARLEDTRLLAVVGPSGGGKSSLVKAGLLPTMEAGFMAVGTSRWRVAETRPGQKPFVRLAEALIGALGSEWPNTPECVSMMASRLRRGPLSLVELLRDRPLDDGTGLVILVDQFEELIRFHRQIEGDDADAFVALLLATINAESPVYFVLTMRSDYVGRSALFRGLPEALSRNQYLTPRLTREQLRDAILGPARMFNGDVEPTLVNELLNEVGRDQDQLPILQHALMRLWARAEGTNGGPSATAGHDESASSPRLLSMTHYDQIGGLEQALSRHADEAYLGLDEAQRPIAEVMFRALCERDPEHRDARRPTRLGQIAEIAAVSIDQARAVADVFRRWDYSFLTPSVADTERIEAQDVLDITHESLIRQWARLRDWTEREAESAGFYQRLRITAQAWESKKAALWRSPDLDAALLWERQAKPSVAWAERYGGSFPLVTEFLRKSERAQVRRRFVYGAGVLAVVVAIAGVFLWYQKDVAEKTALRSSTFAAAALGQIERDPQTALGLALEAARVGGDYRLSPLVQGALRASLRRSKIRQSVRASAGAFIDVRAFPDGARIVTAGDGDGVAVWDIPSGKRLRAMIGHGAALRRLALSTDGQKVASGDADGIIMLWEVGSGKKLRTLIGHVDGVEDLAFSPDGHSLASASHDGSARVWDVDTGKEKAMLLDHAGQVKSVAFAHDGLYLATAGMDRRVVLWDVRTGRQVHVLPDFESDISRVSFSPDGRYLAIAGHSGEVGLWDAVTRRPRRMIPAHSNAVLALAFTRDGLRLATAGVDGTARVWDATSGQELARINSRAATTGAGGPERSWLNAVDFGADGNTIVTTTYDGTANVWIVADGVEGMAFLAHRREIRGVAFSADGQLVATSSYDRTAAVWRVADGRLVFRTPMLEYAVKSVAFNPDGKLLAVAELGGASLWDLATGKRQHLFTVAQGPVNDVSFSANGQQILAAAHNSGYVFDLAGRRMLHSLEGHTDEVFSIAAAPGGDMAATGSKDGKVILWDQRSWSKVGSLEGHVLGVLDIAFTPDGKHLVSASKDKTARIWDIASRTLVATLSDHQETVMGVAVGGDGLATATNQGVTLWDSSRHSVADGFPPSQEGAESVAFSPDGRYVAAGGTDGTLRLYVLDPVELLALARTRTVRTLTLDECRVHLGEACGDRPSGRVRPEAGGPARSGEADSDQLRIAAAALREQARTAAVKRVKRGLKEMTEIKALNAGASPDELLRPLARAADDLTQTKELLRQARASDSGLSFEVDDLARATMTAEFLAMVRALADEVDAFPVLGRLIGVVATSDPGLKMDPDRMASELVVAHRLTEAVRLLQHGESHKAAAVLESAPDTDHHRLTIAVRLLARAYRNSFQPAKAAETFAVADILSPDAEGLVEHAWALFGQKNYRTARDKARKALELDPDFDKALFVLGHSLYSLAEHDEAVKALEAVPQTSKLAGQSAAVAGIIYFERLHDLEAGYQRMDAAVMRSMDDMDNWANFAEAAFATGRLGKSERAARRVLEAPSSAGVEPYVALAMRFLLVATAVRQDDRKTASQELGELLRLAPGVRHNGWEYGGTSQCLKKLTVDETKRHFLERLLAYVQSGGKDGSQAELRELLRGALPARSG